MFRAHDIVTIVLQRSYATYMYPKKIRLQITLFKNAPTTSLMLWAQPKWKGNNKPQKTTSKTKLARRCLFDGQCYLRTPSTHSSMKVKDRVCSPSPHISNLSVEVMVFLQNAAGAFSLPPDMKTRQAVCINKIAKKGEKIKFIQSHKKLQAGANLSMFQRVHICYGTAQPDTQSQSL